MREPVRLRIAFVSLALLLAAVPASSSAADPRLGAAQRSLAGLLPQAGAVPPAVPRQRELVALLRQDCGSCHGMRLTGGLGPPLTAAALRAKPADALVATIVSGRPGTAMPPWQRFVSEAEARWLVTHLQADTVDEVR